MGIVGLFVGGKCCFFPTAVFPWDVVFESCLLLTAALDRMGEQASERLEQLAHTSACAVVATA